MGGQRGRFVHVLNLIFYFKYISIITLCGLDALQLKAAETHPLVRPVIQQHHPLPRHSLFPSYNSFILNAQTEFAKHGSSFVRSLLVRSLANWGSLGDGSRFTFSQTQKESPKFNYTPFSRIRIVPGARVMN